MALIALVLVAQADQGPPAYIAIPTRPSVGGACAGSRVQIADNDGQLWCCVASAWAKCGVVQTASSLAGNGSNCSAGQAPLGVDASGNVEGCWTPSAGSPGGAAGNLQTNNGSGGFGAYAGASCAYAVKTLDASGAATCTSAPSIPADISGEGYWVKTASANLSNEVAMGALGSGLVLNTTTTGIPTIYGGASCAYAVKQLDASGAPTCTAAPSIPADLSAMGFVTYQAEASLSAERVLTSGTNTTVDLGTAGQAKVNLSGTIAQGLGGTGAGALTCSGGQHLTSNGTVYSCSADTTYTLPAATATVLGGIKGTGTGIVCSGTDKVTGWAADGTIQCGADLAGAGGAGNFVEVNVDFNTDQDTAATVVTGQAWVTATSKIICSPTMLATTSRDEGAEDAILEGLVAAPHTRVAGTGFTLTVGAPHGGASGVFKFHCAGG